MGLLKGYPGKLGAQVGKFRTVAPAHPAARPVKSASPLGKPGTKTTSVPPRSGIKVAGATRITTDKGSKSGHLKGKG